MSRRCDTANVLLKQGCPTALSALSVALHLETALHLVVNCSFARCVGTDCLLHFGLHFASPAPKEHNSDDWCFRSIGNTSKPAARKINCSDDLWSNVNGRGSVLSIGPSRI